MNDEISSGGVPVIEMSEVAVTHHGRADAMVVAGVTWCVKPGDFWVVGGLHGSGKTDLLNVAAGMSPPASGRHSLFGQFTDQMTEEELLRERLRIGVVFEDGGRLFHHLTVLQNISLAVCYHRDAAEDEGAEVVRPIVAALGLETVAHSNPGGINRAMRQRVGLARALSLQPELLLLDNPISGLAPSQAGWWLNFLQSLSAGHEVLDRRPLTIIVAAGDFAPWRDHGRQFACLHQGRWRDLGGRGELARNCDPVLRELFSAEMMNE